jgi:hydrogenase nickel incorporation protein HypA/HybF
MHELGIAQDMLRIAMEYAAKNKAQRITAFNIEMSAAADESEDSLGFHFEHLMQGTIAEGARIEIVHIPPRVKCLDCTTEFNFGTINVLCPKCHGARVQVLHQDEFKLTSIDIE